MHKCVSFRAYKNADALLRTESLYGRDWLVVPVIALVEGVLQGMNATAPELALFSEFGKVPEGWDGRPLVMNHPVINNIPVSANSPAILEQYAFGMLFNTTAEDLKLKTEAWIDLERVAALDNADINNTIERLQSGEIIEVSTGLFTGVEQTSGVFNGEEYAGIWRGITPDHLAFLSEGITGACSVADGAGAPRINQASSTTWPEFKMPASIQPKNGTPGATGVAGVAALEVNNQAEQIPAQSGAEPEVVAADVLNRLSANAIPANLLSGDVQSLLCSELRKMLGRSCWIFGFTLDNVVYEVYDYGRESYVYYQRSYNIAEDKTVTFGDMATEVRLVTEIVPASTTNTGLTVQASKENTMADGTPGDVKPNAETKPADAAPAPQVVANNAPVIDAPKQRSMSEYLNDMPEEMREVVQNGLKLHAAKKQELVQGLKASGRCKFSDEQLSAMPLDMLENLAELAAVPSYAGTATPKVQRSAADDLPPAPPELFPAK